MAGKGKPLSALAVKTLPVGLHADGGTRGLYLRVLPTGGRSWIFRYALANRRRSMHLGATDVLSLADARAAALDARRLLLQKIDPVDARREQRALLQQGKVRSAWTFKKAAFAVHETLAPGWKNAKHAAQWLATLETYAFPSVGERPVDRIDVAAALEVLKPIWTAKPETARRVRQRMDAVMRWAVAHGYATANPIDAATELLPKQREAAKHHDAMPYAEIPEFLADVEAAAETAARLALRFLILTAARSGEVRGALWHEIDLRSATWTIPAERMKAGREHRVPLSTQAIAVLKRAAEHFGQDLDSFIFPGQRAGAPLSDMAMTKLLRDMEVGAVPHGFRSSFRDWCAEHGVSRELAERALAHTVKDLTEAAYNRSDLLEQRRPVMQGWGNFVMQPIQAACDAKELDRA